MSDELRLRCDLDHTPDAHCEAPTLSEIANDDEIPELTREGTKTAIAYALNISERTVKVHAVSRSSPLHRRTASSPAATAPGANLSCARPRLIARK